MSKFIYIKTADNDAYMNAVSNFRGAVHDGDTSIDLYFDAANANQTGGFDKVSLVINSEKEQEVMLSITGALAGSHSTPMVVLADDVANNYVNGNITSVGTIALGARGNSRVATEVLTAARVVTAADSGTTFVCSGDAGKAITLPSVADAGAGFNCRFIVGQAFATTDWIITATAAVMVGGINELEVDTSDDGPSTIAGTTINIELGAETIGDFVDFTCDGTKFYINGQSKLDGAFTLA
tara:strand:+ start:66 stop:782 length:717 start_codon:yes stop_codon:yes gene_type:complete